MAAHNKNPDHKVRCKDVDDQIEFLFKENMPIFKIAREVPIGEIFIRNCLKERKLLPRPKPGKRFESRIEKDRTYYANTRKVRKSAEPLELEA